MLTAAQTDLEAIRVEMERGELEQKIKRELKIQADREALKSQYKSELYRLQNSDKFTDYGDPCLFDSNVILPG